MKQFLIKNIKDTLETLEDLIDDLDFSEEENKCDSCNKFSEISLQVSKDSTELEIQHTLGNIPDETYELIKPYLDRYKKILTI